MPKTKLFPYPLPEGTHVVAKVRRLDLTGDETIAGTIVRVIRPRPPRSGNSVSYAVRTQSGAVIEALASRTTPIDTSTTEGLDKWLDVLENEPDPTLLPGPDLSAGGQALAGILWNGPLAPDTGNTITFTNRAIYSNTANPTLWVGPTPPGTTTSDSNP